jgi:hypothetical protein
MDPNQTARMRRLVWIHAGHNVRFVMTRLISLSKGVALQMLYCIYIVYSIKETSWSEKCMDMNARFVNGFILLISKLKEAI